MTEPQHLFQLGDGEFPPLRSLNQTNLPVAASPLIGRERELNELIELVREGTRVVTVTGPGGSGKTRLALQAAAENVDNFRGGVFWVPLAGVAEANLVLPTVAQTLGVKEDLETYLAEREVLLVLDNFEHLLSAAPSVATLLMHAPNARVLATSRAPLHIEGEREYQLDPFTDVDAVAFFVERARDAGRQLAPDATVAEICRRLDALPLALELAAARTKLITPDALLARLERRLPLLAGGRRDAPARQQTLRATIEWSYDLLAGEAKQLLARLAVFAGSFSLDAAEQVCEAELEDVAALVDLSLLKPIGESRFLMLETIREFAAELLESATAADVRQRHAAFYSALAEEAEPQLEAGNTALLAVLESEHANIRAALRELLEHDAEAELLLAARLRDYWRYRGFWGEGREWLREGVDATSATIAHVKGRLALGFLAFLQGDWQNAEANLTAARSLAAELSYDVGSARAANLLALLAHYQDENAAADQLAEEALALARREGDAFTVASALGVRGAVARQWGDLDRAESLIEESAAISRAKGFVTELSFRMFDLGMLARVRGDNGRAEDIFHEALRLSRQLGDYANTALGLAVLVDLARRRGDVAEARALADEALVLQRDLGDDHGVSFTTRMLALVDLTEGNVACAHDRLVDALAIAQRVGDRLLIATTVEALAITAVAEAGHARAARLLGAADAIRAEIELPRRPFEEADLAGAFSALRSELGDAGLAAERDAGRKLSIEEAGMLATATEVAHP